MSEIITINPLRLGIFREVDLERERQIVLRHGGDTAECDKQNTSNDWVAYISTYAGRATAKVGLNFRTNMIKVAALAVAAIEAFDARQSS